MHYLTVRHPLIVERVYCLQQVFDLFFLCDYVHRLQHLFEFLLVDNAICILVDCLVEVSELLKESLVL